MENYMKNMSRFRIGLLSALLIASVAVSAQTVTNLSVLPGTASVYAEWRSAHGNRFDVSVSDTSGAVVRSATVYEQRALIGGLDTSTSYRLTVTPWNGNTRGAIDSAWFRTRPLGCAEYDTALGATGTYTVGTPGTSSCNVMPVTQPYHYSYVMHWIRRSELQMQGAAVITGVDFEYAYSQPMTHATNCSIYMAHTTTQDHSNGFVPFDSLTMVYEGPLNARTAGWNHWSFNRGNFRYDGVRNMVLVIVSNSGVTDGAEYVFNYQQISGISKRHYNDTTPYTPAFIRTLPESGSQIVISQWRSNMRLTTGACSRTATCAPPQLVDTLVTANSASLVWAAGWRENSWNLEYKEQDSTRWRPLLTASGDTSYTIRGLNAGSVYDVRLTAICTDTTMSSQLSLFAVSGTRNMSAGQTDTVTLCEGMLYDNGGPNGNYANSQNSTVILRPPLGGTVTLQGLFTGDAGNDHLYIYDGWTSADTLLCDVVSPSAGTQVAVPMVTATNPDGVLRVQFVSNVLEVDRGFELFVSCASATCPPVRGLSAQTVTQNSATLQWTAGGSETCWEVTCNGATTYVNTPIYTIYGLAPATSYTARVRPVCSAGDTGRMVSTSFTTLCGTFTVTAQGYQEGFESQTSLPSCWQQDGVNDTWQVVDFATYYSGGVLTAHGGNNVAMIESPDERANLVTPIFDISGLTSTKLVFWHLQEAYQSDQDTLTVLARSSASGQWTQLARYTSDISSWQCDSIALAGYSTIQLAFHADCGYGYGVVVDDVRITGVVSQAACTPPSGAATTSATATTATVSWTGAGQFEVAYKTASSSQWGTAVQVSATTHTFSGLTAATQYDWRVRKVCSATEQSSWATGSFTTQQPAPCEVPTSLGVTSTTTTNATVQWSGAGRFEVAYKEAASSQWGAAMQVSATTYTFSGLTAATQYDWRVRKVCSATEQSSWATGSFTTQQPGIDPDPCEVPTGLSVGSIAPTGATVDWSAPAAQHSWQLMVSGASTMDTTVGSHPVQLTRLVPATTYSAMVRAVCDDGQRSDWSAAYSFTTASADGMQTPQPQGLFIELYPNPAQQGSGVTLSILGADGDVCVQLFDITGRQLFSSTQTCSADCMKHFDLAGIGSGTYFVKVRTAQTSTVKKLNVVR